ncbi:MAG: redox-regulated ATPase YchF [Bacillota bacterium]
MQIGLVGLPQAGKTTFFNLLTGANCSTDYTGADEVHSGSAVVPDVRIDFLESLYKPRKKTYARIEFKDIPGVRMGESAARATRLLDEARGADALVQVVRAFTSKEVAAMVGAPAPYRDLTDYSAELLLADMDAVEKRLARIKHAPKVKKDAAAQVAVLERLLEALGEERLVSSVQLNESDRQLLAGQNFLSEKPFIAVINLDEAQLATGSCPDRKEILDYTAPKGIPVLEICAQVEMEISRLSPGEQVEFLKDLQLNESGLGRLSRTVYEHLGLVSFFTVGEDEVKAWTVQKGTPARQAAGKVHSDIERGFIRAEIFHYADIAHWGSAARVKEMGLFRLEGKEYLVKDGDIINFRFNV